MASFSHSLWKLLRYVTYVLIAVVVVTFSTTNRGNVTLDLFPLGYEIDIPLFLLVFISFIGGLLSGNMSLLLSRISALRDLKRARERISALENEVSILESTHTHTSTATTTTPTDNKVLSTETTTSGKDS